MQLVKLDVGGALMRWEGGSPPAALDIFDAGAHILRQPLIRFPATGGPVASLINSNRLGPSMKEVEIVEGPTEGIGWGTNVGEQWTIKGEDTPFCYRESGPDLKACRFDLSRAAGLDGFEPAPGQTYYFSADTAQHRCGMGLSMDWLDARGRVLHRDECWRETGPWGGARASDYATMVVSGACPPKATGLRIAVAQGPPTEGEDAYIFFRRVALTLEDPSGRAMLSIGRMTARIGEMAILPLGDAVQLAAGPLEVSDGEERVTIGEVARPAGTAGPPPTAICNGPYLEIVADAGSGGAFYLAVDDVFLGFFVLPGGEGGTTLSVALPLGLLDGQAHWVELRGAAIGERLYGGLVDFPATQTPPDVLQTHTSRIDRPAVVPFAALRYEALAATIERLGRAETVDPAMLPEVAASHRYVLRGPQPDQSRFEPRHLSGHAAPRFSIVVPVHDNFHLTYFCLASILYTCAGLPYEIIVVDDGSSDQSRRIEHIVTGVRVVRHAKALGFVGACNAGAAAARGQHIVFLNNDTEVVGRWLEELHLPFVLFPMTGLTGAKLVYPDGRLQEAGGIVWGNGHPWNVGRNGNPADPAFSYTRQADYVSGAAIMIAADVWRRVGGFSREFEPAYYEDTDLAFKVREAGYRAVFAAKATVIHYEGRSNGTDTGGAGLKRFQEINRPKFEAKWRRAYRLGGVEGVQPDLEKDRGPLGRALVLDYQSPRFDKDAGSYAISQEIRLLQGLGYKVTLATLNGAHLGIYTDALERGGVEHLHAPFFASLQDVVERRGAEFGLVYIHRYTTAEGLVGLIRRHAPDARIVINCADLHFLREIRAARVEGSTDAFERAIRTRERELAVFGEVDAVLTYSEIEKAIIETYLGMRAKVHLTPWVAPTPPPPVPLSRRDGIGFIGSFDHPPNRDAMEFFLAECWPAIRARDPDVVLHIAGSGFEKFRPAVPDDRVRVVGWVEDASEFLSRRRVMIAPLRAGAGIKGKVIDAFNSGTPAILSTIAAEGIVSGSRHQIVARVADEWIERVCRLLDDDEAWEAESVAARERIEDQFSYANGLSMLGRVFQSIELPHASQFAGSDAEVFASAIPFSEIHKALDQAASASAPETPVLADAAE